jgi:hypothetical protein
MTRFGELGSFDKIRIPRPGSYQPAPDRVSPYARSGVRVLIDGRYHRMILRVRKTRVYVYIEETREERSFFIPNDRVVYEKQV